ncbi:NUDIX domain-containing protein [Candidatus Woesearchaeota archaeon]|nr:MAG: NUDIX domain-containing protein [Candidatus Woesearchaeota archaeon]
MGNITKVAVLPITDKKLLMCRKRGIEALINLGGRVEEGETDTACAEREVLEEAQCGVENLHHYTTVTAPRIDDPHSQIELRCYFGDLTGEPTVRESDSIIGFTHIDRTYDSTKLPPAMQKVFAKLISDGYL